ncbi:MAG: hypothetical protein GX936_05320 [Clostridiales bacterium]|jgi:hypothetical protein|nr:hypothetical protein [Clostridiales bacterium]
MGLGDFNFFIWKSKAQIQKEQEEYEKWAFPYGQPQREKLVKLMLEIFPKENEATVLIPFLTCKELFCNLAKTPDLVDAAINKLLTDIKKYKRIIRKQDMPTYVALVVADSKVDERLEYPTAQEIKDMAEAFLVTKT